MLALALISVTSISRGDITINAVDNGMTTTISYSGSIITTGIGKGGGASITGRVENAMGTRVLDFAPNAMTSADWTGNVIMGTFVVPDGYFLRNINSPATNHMGDIFGIEAANLYYPVGYVSGTNISGSIVINDTGFIDSTMVRQTTLSAGAGTITFNPVSMPAVLMPAPPAPDMNAINQVIMSGLPVNGSLNGIARNLNNAGSRDIGQRLFRNRTRFEPQNGATTSVGWVTSSTTGDAR